MLYRENDLGMGARARGEAGSRHVSKASLEAPTAVEVTFGDGQEPVPLVESSRREEAVRPDSDPLSVSPASIRAGLLFPISHKIAIDGVVE